MTNNSILIFSIGAAIGIGFGAVSSYVFFKKRKEKELDRAIEECNREIDKLQEDIKKKTSEIEEAHSQMNVKNVMAQYGSNLALTKEQYQNLYSGEKYDEEMIHPDRASSDPADFEHPEEEEEDYISEESDESSEEMTESYDVDPFEEEIRDANQYAKERRPPKFITEDAFEYEGRGVYEKCDLYYYVFDKTLATEDEEVIDDEYRIVGNALDKYGFRDNDEAEIYVRNFATMTDYRITKMFSESFSGKY